MTEPCPFCAVPTDQIFYADALVVGIWDRHPVSPGHALLLTKRHVASWFEASAEEQQALIRAIAIARTEIERDHAPKATTSESTSANPPVRRFFICTPT